jgi:hypothetical protein
MKKEFKVMKFSTMWSTSGLTEKVEKELYQKSDEGWDIISVAFGVNLWWMPTAFISLSRQIEIKNK